MASLSLSVWLSDSLRSALLLWAGLMMVFCLLALLLALFYRLGRELGGKAIRSAFSQ